MQVGATGGNPVGGSEIGGAELRSAKLAKGQQEAEGKAALELLKSADTPPPQSGDPAIGSNINIKV